jgi:PIN domain nuclease of toxin-antitoxin system
MDLLLDTHALFWSIYDVASLSEEATAALVDPANTVWATLTSPQEISMKIGVGRWPDALDLLLNFDERLEESRYSLVAPIAADYANQLMLPDLADHRDPFDRLIIAQALARGMSLVTSDGHAADYGVQTLHAGRAARVADPRGPRLVPAQTLNPIALPTAPPREDEGA